MEKQWLIFVLASAFICLCVLKTEEVNHLRPFIKMEKGLKIEKFSKVKLSLAPADRPLLELWESILTGRSRQLPKGIKDSYQVLGLKHLFTPSGFHLSAVMTPLLKISTSLKFQLALIMTVGFCVYFLPGLGALKRMVLVKGNQKILGTRTGLAAGLVLDCIWGSFQSSPLGFTYSFLFLGIVYSGAKGLGLAFWFFMAQAILAYFQGNHLSPLLLILSPLLNFAFGMVLPVLFLLSVPLWGWQVQVGIILLRFLQGMVDISANIISLFPVWEINIGMILILILFTSKRFKLSAVILLFFCQGLNLDLQNTPLWSSHEFQPNGSLRAIRGEFAFYEESKCKISLIRGFWWERCSPKRRSSKKN